MKNIALIAIVLSVVTFITVKSTPVDSYLCDPSDPYSDECQHL